MWFMNGVKPHKNLLPLALSGRVGQTNMGQTNMDNPTWGNPKWL